MKSLSLFLIFILLTVSCSQSQKPNALKNMDSSNPVVYFEIPLHDLARAEKFYSAVFNFSFEKEIIDRYEMALFPFEEKNSGITGALAKGDVYQPSKNGVIIYFKSENIDQTLEKVLQHGGSVLYPKRIDEKYGFAVAEFEDSEGNRIALHETVK
ncbi:putative enzyme related to lactoylglutathione lyase [Chryseobacterium sp. PvR013]|nr:putative enzyme related to lactoylglutathione lyase [Chryseobacterium sp. PvR013]